MKKDKNFSFVAIRGKLYPSSITEDKASLCPMPHVSVDTLATKCQFAHLPSHLEMVRKSFPVSEFCWHECTLECPAKKRIEDALKVLVDVL